MLTNDAKDDCEGVGEIAALEGNVADIELGPINAPAAAAGAAEDHPYDELEGGNIPHRPFWSRFQAWGARLPFGLRSIGSRILLEGLGGGLGGVAGWAPYIGTTREDLPTNLASIGILTTLFGIGLGGVDLGISWYTQRRESQWIYLGRGLMWGGW